jgi:hexosaminidase
MQCFFFSQKLRQYPPGQKKFNFVPLLTGKHKSLKMNFLQIMITAGIVFLLFSCKDPVPRPPIRIVPLPAVIIEHDGLFTLSSSTTIENSIDSEEMRQLALFLTNHTQKYFGITNTVVAAGSGVKASIFLKINENLKLGKEDYHLTITSDEIVLEAVTPNGIFYGIQTLIQLMPASPKQMVEVILPAVEINDTPRFAWRGLQLDVSRHFMPKTFMFKYLDYMAMHKFNTLHWHLADDQGWRIEIKKYPLLTEIGAVRKKTLIGHANNPAGTDTIPIGGFYSQNDVREIVSYASERFITIVPGIEMPGHALAALASYPELGCTESPYEVATRWGIFSDVYCPGKDGTYAFFKEVFTEMAPLFPGRYFHIGGAECSEMRWERCPQCQLRIKKDSLNSTHDLYNYFVRRINNTLDSLGKERIGWDESVKDTMLMQGTVMSWHGDEGAIVSAQLKLKTIMSPAKYCNFDQYQADPKSEPLAVGGLLTLEQVYAFEPVPAALSSRSAKYIIGAQGNLWTQYMKTPEYVEYMTFPRAAALAEVVWSPKASHNYPWFKRRMAELIKRYDAAGIRYCKAEFKSN